MRMAETRVRAQHAGAECGRGTAVERAGRTAQRPAATLKLPPHLRAAMTRAGRVACMACCACCPLAPYHIRTILPSRLAGWLACMHAAAPVSEEVAVCAEHRCAIRGGIRCQRVVVVVAAAFQHMHAQRPARRHRQGLTSTLYDGQLRSVCAAQADAASCMMCAQACSGPQAIGPT